MDTPSPITHISLCAGYGGIDLGLKRAIPNLRTIAFSEIEAFPIANLVSKMEAGLLDCAPVWTNLKTFPWGKFRGVVDILSGGFPCQPFSCAGSRNGDEDPRHLFPYILEGIKQSRPSVVFLENVEGILSAKLSGEQWRDPAGTPVLLHVLRELERVGYKVSWGIFSASEVGAPHQRKRVFIIAHREYEGSQGRLRGWTDQEREGLDGHIGCGSSSLLGRWPSRPGQPQYAWEPPRVVGNIKNERNINSTQQDIPEAGALLDRASEGASMADASDGGCCERRARATTSLQGECSERTGSHEEPGTSGELSRGSEGCSNDATDSTGESLVDAEGERTNGRWKLCSEDGRSHGSLFRESEPTSSETGKLEHPSNEGQPLGRSCAEGRSEPLQESKRPDGSDEREVKPPLGLHSDGITAWMDLSRLSGLSHQELEEIYQWMERTTNRTDELRSCGNGVVPDTAELAFRTLFNELTK